MVAEGRELLGPSGFGRVEPRAKTGYRRGVERVDADTSIEVRMCLRHEATLSQDAEMLAHDRRCDAERFGKFAGAMWSLPQQFHRAPSYRIGQRAQRVIDGSGVGAHAQFFATIGWPIAVSASARVTSRTCIENTHT